MREGVRRIEEEEGRGRCEEGGSEEGGVGRRKE